MSAKLEALRRATFRSPALLSFLVPAAFCAAGALVTSSAVAQARPPELFVAAAKDESMLARARVPASKNVKMFNLNNAALKERSFRMTLEGTGELTFTRTSFDEKNDHAVWAATDSKVASATLVIRKGKVTGTVTSPKGLFRIIPVDDGTHALVEVDLKTIPPDEPKGMSDGRENRVQEDKRNGTGNDRHHRDGKNGNGGRNGEHGGMYDHGQLRNDHDGHHGSGGGQEPIEVKVLVAYTSAATGAVYPDIDTTVALAIAESNQAYANSKINLKLSLAELLHVTYSESGKSYPTMLDDLMAMTDVAQHRDSKDADVVVLLFNEPGACGLAQKIGADADTAFAIVHGGCATGVYSFSHEIAHLMGARHDIDHDSAKTPFPYGHGFQVEPNGAQLGWRTIMAEDCKVAPCVRVQYFSNPCVDYEGAHTGTDGTSDNAKVLNQMASYVASFRPAPIADASRAPVSKRRGRGGPDRDRISPTVHDGKPTPSKR